MKAIVLVKPETLRLMDIPEPIMTESNHVIIKVMSCGICGSDIRYRRGENPWALHTLGKHVDNPPNIVLGHEFSGIVVKVNSRENEKWLGKRVGVQPFRVCNKCRLCVTGRTNLCKNTIHIGHAQGWEKMDYYPGAYAEYCLGWADLLHPVSEHITFDEAAMGDILSVAVHVVGRTNIYKGAAVLCIGGGPAGLSIAQIAKNKRAGEIFISDPSPIARSVIRNYHNFNIIETENEDIVSVIKGKIGNKKCAAIFDSVGSEDTFNTAIPLLEDAGTYVNLAVHGTSLNINMQTLGSERTITTSSNAFYSDVTKAFELLNSNKINVQPWITHRLPLEEFEKAFDLLTRSPKEAYKIVFNP
jgi:threonine dehydrogenase-like Zn-dependent dehydrogenase